MRAFIADHGKRIWSSKATNILHSLIRRHKVLTLMFIGAWNNVSCKIPFDQLSSKPIEDVSHNLSYNINSLFIAMSMRKKKYKEK